MKYDIAIIGGGIIGLSAARILLTKRPKLKIAILEKEKRIAMHQSGRNSGVIHSGVYYEPKSEKARLCVKGSKELYRFCERKGIPFKKIGKVIVALEEPEQMGLEQLFERGKENGVEGIRLIDGKELRQIEPYAAGLSAIYCPETGIVDFVRVCESFLEEIKSQGGEIFFHWEAKKIHCNKNNIAIMSEGRKIQSKYLLICAGIYSDRLAQLSGGRETPRVIPFRGDYLLLKKSARYLVRGLIYPVPDPRFPFLGVHFTPRMDGEVWLGPNAVLAFGRESYRFCQWNFKDALETLTYPGFLRLAGKYWRTGMMELYRDLFKSAYTKELKRYLPDIKNDDCEFGSSGIRAQTLNEDGSLVEDFLFEQIGDRILCVRNAPSPAATSSLAIGEAIVEKFEGLFEN